jgi:cardiolipin synthase
VETGSQLRVDSRSAFFRDLRTIPNILSLLRICLVFVAAYFLLTGWVALGLLVGIPAALTDYLDGYLARRLGLATRLGALLDSLADLVYSLVVFGLAIHFDIWPVYLVVVWGLRDMSVMAMRASAAQQGFDISSIFLSKLGANFNFYSFLLVGIEIYLTDAQILLDYVHWVHGLGLFGIHAGLVMYWISGSLYVRSYVQGYSSGVETTGKGG